MAVHIESKDGNVKIHADDGSVVRNVRVGDRVYVGEPDPLKRAGRILSWAGILLLIVAFWLVVFGACRTAHGADCSVLHDADERHMCRALTQCLKSECEFIEKPDARQVCRIRIETNCKGK